MAPTETQTGITEGWPYSCNRCSATVYHDARRCGDCEVPALPAGRESTRARWRSAAWFVAQVLTACVSLVL